MVKIPERIPKGTHHVQEELREKCQERCKKLEEELEVTKKMLKQYEAIEKRNRMHASSYEGMVSEIISAVGRLEGFSRNIIEPENICAVLKYIINRFAAIYSDTSDIDSPIQYNNERMINNSRNRGIELICEQLNKLQKQLTFDKKYKVTYKEGK